MLKDRIQELFDRSGLTVDEFAARVDLPTVRVSAILRGERAATSLDTALIAEACQVSVGWLLGADGPFGGGSRRLTYCTASWMYIEGAELVDLSCSLSPGHEKVWPHYDINAGQEWSE